MIVHSTSCFLRGNNLKSVQSRLCAEDTAHTSQLQGLCFKRPAADVLGVSEHALQEWRPGQVVLVTDMPLTQQQSSIWLDNLFICHRSTARSPSEYLIKVKGSDAKLWMTKTTLCGDGLRKPEQGAIRVDTGQMYAEGAIVLFPICWFLASVFLAACNY